MKKSQSIEEILPLTWLENRVLEDNKVYDIMRDRKVLDVGCGTGFFTRRIAEKASKVVGIDICENNIKFAKFVTKERNVEFKTMDANNIRFPAGYFDAVFCSEVVEHVLDKQALLDRISKILRPDGYVIMALTVKPKRTAFMYRAHKFFDKAYDKDAPEVHKGGMFAPLQTIDKSLSKHGFVKKSSIRYRSPILFSIEILITFIERLTRGKKKVECFADNSDKMDSAPVKFYIKYLLPIVKASVRLDSMFNFIDTTNMLVVYHRVRR